MPPPQAVPRISEVSNGKAAQYDVRRCRLDGKPKTPNKTTPQVSATHSNVEPPPRNAPEGPNSRLEAVVVIVKVAVAPVVVESSATEVGLSEQPIFAVAEERLQERLTVPLNPPAALTVIVVVPDFPEEMDTFEGLAETE